MADNKLQLTPLLSRFAGAAAREVGARHLEDQVCRSRMIKPPINTKLKEAYTCGCGNEAKFEIPATGDQGGDLRHPEGATVCAVCDRAYDFPRYGGGQVP